MKKSSIGYIPLYWSVGEVGDIALEKKKKIDLNKANSSYNYIGLEHIPRNSIALNAYENSGKVSGNKTIFSENDILFGKLRPYFKKVGLAPVDGVCSTDIIVLISKNCNSKAYLLQQLIRDSFIEYTSSTATGTRMPRTNSKLISKYNILIPDSQTLDKFENIVGEYNSIISSLLKENRDLKKLRDTLLPKLMSGEIELPDNQEV